MSSDLYLEAIIEEYQHPQNQGQLADPDLTLHDRNASCGDEATIDVKFANRDQSQPIIDIKWRGQGCAISTAALSVLSAQIKAKKLTLAQVSQLTQRDIEQLLGLEDISPARVKCLLLGLETLKRALNEKTH